MDTSHRINPASPQLAHTIWALKGLAGLLLLLPLVLVPLIALWWAGPEVLTEHAVLDRYREVDAVVIDTRVERRMGGGASSYTPRVAFRYTVDGRIYEADRLTPRDVPGTLRWARKHVAKFQRGDRVIAYYDPRDPSRAFLERRGAPPLTATFFLPVPVLALAFWLAANARTKKARQRSRVAEAAAD